MSQGGQGRMETTGRVLMDSQKAPCMCVIYYFFFESVCLWICIFGCRAHVHIHLHMRHLRVFCMLMHIGLRLWTCACAWLCLCVCFFSVLADYWAGMPRGSMLFHTKQWKQYLFVADKTGWPEIGMHIITHTHAHTHTLLSRSHCMCVCVCACTLYRGLLCVCYLCMCVWVIHSYKDTIDSPSYSFHFPRDKVPISPLPAVRQKDEGGGGCKREGRERARE